MLELAFRRPANAAARGPRAALFDELLIKADIVAGHPARGEALLEATTDGVPVDTIEPGDRFAGLGLALDDEAGEPILDDLGNGAAGIGYDRGAAGHCLDHDEAERLRPVDREKQRPGAAEEFGLLLLVDFADELDARTAEERADGAREISFVDAVDLGGHLEGQSALLGDADR